MIPWAFNHLGLAVPNIGKALAFYDRAFGFGTLSDVYRDEIQQARVVFVGPPQEFSDRRAKGFVLELIEPSSADSHLHRLLKSSSGAYHICYAVPDIEAGIAHLADCGCLKVRGPEPAVAYNGNPIAWCYAPTRHLIELVELK